MAAALTAAALAMTFAACGSSDESSTTSGGGTQASTGSTGATDTSSTTAAKPASGEPISFGTLAQLSGPYTLPDTKNALDALAKQVNDAGGVRGRPIKFDVCDGSFADPQNQPNCVRKIVGSDDLAFVGGVYELGATKPAAANDMAVITSASTAPETTTAPTTFMVNCTQICDTRAMSATIPKLGVKKLGIVYNPQPGLTQAVDEYKKLLEPQGIEVVDIPAPAETTNFTSYMSKAKSAGVDMILTFAGGQQIPLIVKGMKNIAYNPKIAGNVGICDPTVTDQLQGVDIVCTLYAKPWNDPSWDPLNEAMAAIGHEDYQKNYTAYQAWTNGQIAVQALKAIPEGTEITRKSFLDAVSKVKYENPMLPGPGVVDFAALPGPCDFGPRIATGWVNVIEVVGGEEPKLVQAVDTCK